MLLVVIEGTDVDCRGIVALGLKPLESFIAFRPRQCLLNSFNTRLDVFDFTPMAYLSTAVTASI